MPSPFRLSHTVLLLHSRPDSQEKLWPTAREVTIGMGDDDWSGGCDKYSIPAMDPTVVGEKAFICVVSTVAFSFNSYSNWDDSFTPLRDFLIVGRILERPETDDFRTHNSCCCGLFIMHLP